MNRNGGRFMRKMVSSALVAAAVLFCVSLQEAQAQLFGFESSARYEMIDRETGRSIGPVGSAG
jgi:hypothetical protein